MERKIAKVVEENQNLKGKIEELRRDNNIYQLKMKDQQKDIEIWVGQTWEIFSLMFYFSFDYFFELREK